MRLNERLSSRTPQALLPLVQQPAEVRVGLPSPARPETGWCFREQVKG